MPGRSRRYYSRFPRGDDDDDLDRDQIFPRERCDWCGKWNCECDALFDADELGLDPEDDDARRYRETEEDEY